MITPERKLVLVLGKNGQVSKSINKFKSNAKFDLSFVDSSHINLNTDFKQKLCDCINQFKPSFIVNAAAFTAVDAAEKNIDSAMQINGYAVGIIAKLCSKFNIPLFHYSTDYVFGDNGSDFLSPKYKKNPLGAYGKSKLLGEELINQMVSKNNLKAIILRISWVFSENENNFVNTILNLSKDKDHLRIINDQFGGPTSSDSVAIATIETINAYFEKYSSAKVNQKIWGEYHFQGRPIVSWFEFANFIIHKANELGLIGKKPIMKAITSRDYNSSTKRQLNSRLCMKLSHSLLELKAADWKKDVLKILEDKKVKMKLNK